ncbi:NAD(P)H-dependent glycerol-3-phosphate dehydrogenase [Dinoroseobacter sp. S124A]|uniref:NAD(P)H-dependent glycerol-3-phosphate dehydrogenase n=1 Tax=Dinoroseobacter sp. S124A TaxID=3415128 RepID=UPI003C7E2DC6
MSPSIDVMGAGAFGSALAIALCRGGRDVRLWCRDPAQAEAMTGDRKVPRLPGVTLPPEIAVTADAAAMTAPIRLLAVPMQVLGGHLAAHRPPPGTALVACCKGLDLATRQGPTGLIQSHAPDGIPAVLTGPSFAADIARGLPTALTLACADGTRAVDLQNALSTEDLRLYRSADPIGAELGGALKNVVAIAAGLVIGAGLGESARAALMTRGYVEMQRLARHLGAQPTTLAGLSGFGDMVLTATSKQSRNFAYGQALGAGTPPAPGVTVEGRATAQAVAGIAAAEGLDMPICTMVSAVIDETLTIEQAMGALMSRDLREE